MPSKNYDLKFSPIAEEDLDEIYNYISTKLFAEKAAKKLMEKIEARIMRLADLPFSCNFVTNELLKNRGYRKLIVDNYIVFYRVNEVKKQVVIMPILYGASNYENIL